MAKITHTVVLLVFLLVQATLIDAYRTCYDCARIPYPKDCDHVIKCADDSVCYVEEIITDSGVVLFNLGCRSRKKCQPIVRRHLPTTIQEHSRDYDIIDDVTGDLIICEQCCEGDHCNSHGCNSELLPPLGSRGPVCYSCHQHATEDSCDTLRMCDTTETVRTSIKEHSDRGFSCEQSSLMEDALNTLRCFMSTVISHSQPNHLFTSDCKPHHFCDHIPIIAVGRRDVPTCTGCCTEDYCNRNCSAITHHITQQSSSTHMPSSQTTRAPPIISTFTTTRVTIPSTTTTAVVTTTVSTTPSTTTTAVIDRKLCEMLGYDYVATESFSTCYKLYNAIGRSWQESRDRCNQDGGDLVVFKDITEAAFFVEQTKRANHLDLVRLVRFWVGASDHNTQHDWRWLDGSAVNTSYFHPKEPNNQHGNEHCAALAQFALHGNIALNDDVCSVVTNFICEITLKDLQSKTTPATSTHCRNHDYTYVPETGICYKLYNTVQKTQNEARLTCQGQQADLLILRNITIERFYQHLNFHVENEFNGRYWLGGERRPGDNRNTYDAFQWYNGHVLDSGLEWFAGEPNNYDNDEDCLTFTYFNSKPLSFSLNDDQCSKQHYFICEEKCPDLSYQYFPDLDLCFKVYNQHVTWSEARDLCRQDHADLMEPDSTKKLEFIETFLNETATGDIQDFWIGATDENHDGSFEWLTSSKVVPAEFWHKGEPSAQSAGEHCASLYLYRSDGRTLMNDAHCSTDKFRFICQDIW